MPSIVAQSTPPLRAAVFRFVANLGDRRSAGGVGSGSGVLSQTVAALGGPSISGFGAGLVFCSNTARGCSVLARARLTAVCPGRSLWADAPGAEAFACNAPDA